MRKKKLNRTLIRAAAVVAVGAGSPLLAETSSNTENGTPVRQGQTGGVNNPAATISISGQTALRGFTNAPAISYLAPTYDASGNPVPHTITLNIGPGGAPVTYTTNSVGGSQVQLASGNFTLADTGTNYSPSAPNSQRHSALRIEWHEQGSGDGFVDLINDQIGYAGGAAGTPLSNIASRGASTSNPTWVNTNSFNGTTTSINGFTLQAGNFANTYTDYDRATGAHLTGRQNRIQFSVGEFKTESLSKAGGTASYGHAAGTAGYGLGNSVLTPSSGSSVGGLGVAGGRTQLRSDTIANLAQTTIDPQSPASGPGANATYAAGPWNSAGANNIDSKQIAVTAVPFVANPGTGLTRINQGDAQWLQTSGRLQNGADFNVGLRTIDAGQRIVPALNIGIDPSWAVGENDDGNTSGSAAAAVQRSIGTGIRFSGKTSGPEARNVIAQSRLGFGPLSLAETRGASSAAPLRALDVAFGFSTDPANTADFIHLNFDSIVNGTYKTILISHYNTVKQARPDLLAQYQAANPGASDAQIQTWWNGLSSDANAGVDAQGIAKGTTMESSRCSSTTLPAASAPRRRASHRQRLQTRPTVFLPVGFSSRNF